jgi:2-polyprenyl-3-methyl-5-hydroxy-6-metoxy-1,4-benzoquinol methylase
MTMGPAPVAPIGSPSIRLELVSCPNCDSRATKFERIVEGYVLERCRACGLVFVNPQPTRDDINELYLQKTPESQADFYLRTVSPAQIYEYDRILRDLRALAPAGDRLLDLGCAAGYFMQRANAAGFTAHGIDLATWVETIAAKRGVRNVRAITLRGAGFEDAFFDVVHSSQVFEHLPRPHEELREITRILKPGGVLYLNVPNYQCLSIVFGRDDFELNTPPEHVTYFTPRTLSTLLATAGFDVIRTAAYGGVKWENLLGRPIRSEIAEAVRAKDSGASPTREETVFQPVEQPSLVGRLVRAALYRHLRVGMTLEIFARRK